MTTTDELQRRQQHQQQVDHVQDEDPFFSSMRALKAMIVQQQQSPNKRSTPKISAVNVSSPTKTSTTATTTVHAVTTTNALSTPTRKSSSNSIDLYQSTINVMVLDLQSKLQIANTTIQQEQVKRIELEQHIYEIQKLLQAKEEQQQVLIDKHENDVKQLQETMQQEIQRTIRTKNTIHEKEIEQLQDQLQQQQQKQEMYHQMMTDNAAASKKNEEVIQNEFYQEKVKLQTQLQEIQSKLVMEQQLHNETKMALQTLQENVHDQTEIIQRANNTIQQNQDTISSLQQMIQELQQTIQNMEEDMEEKIKQINDTKEIEINNQTSQIEELQDLLSKEQMIRSHKERECIELQNKLHEMEKNESLAIDEEQQQQHDGDDDSAVFEGEMAKTEVLPGSELSKNNDSSSSINKKIVAPDSGIVNDVQIQNDVVNGTPIGSKPIQQHDTTTTTATHVKSTIDPTNVQQQKQKQYIEIEELNNKLLIAQATAEKEKQLRMTLEQERDEVLLECRESRILLFDTSSPMKGNSDNVQNNNDTSSGDQYLKLSQKEVKRLLTLRVEERKKHLKEMDRLHIELQRATSQRDSMEAKLHGLQLKLQQQSNEDVVVNNNNNNPSVTKEGDNNDKLESTSNNVNSSNNNNNDLLNTPNNRKRNIATGTTPTTNQGIDAVIMDHNNNNNIDDDDDDDDISYQKENKRSRPSDILGGIGL